MIRLALAVLAGATIVAAQVPQATDAGEGTNTDRPDITTMKGQFGEGPAINLDSLKEKFGDRDTTGMGQRIEDAIERCGTKVDSAREASREARGEIGTRDSTKRERIQGAIDALDRNSTRMGTQVKDVQQRTQIRMTERRDEHIQLQQRIRERKAEQDAAKVTEPEVDVPATDAAAQ